MAANKPTKFNKNCRGAVEGSEDQNKLVVLAYLSAKDQAFTSLLYTDIVQMRAHFQNKKQQVVF